MLATCVSHGHGLGHLDATSKTFADCFEESLRRMIGRVDENAQEEVDYWLDLENLHRVWKDVVQFCVRDFDDSTGTSEALKLVQLVCGYHSENVGKEAVYRFRRLVDLCRRRESARVLDMAATNAAQWMERTMF